MPTARELLEQADALMRRNRRRGSAKHGPPTLTDALGVDRDAPLAPTIILPESVVAEADPIALDTLSDLPVLTDVVDVWPSAASEVSSPSAEDELSPATLDDALEADALAAVDAPEERTEGEATPSVPVVSAYETPQTEATSSEPAVSAYEAPETEATSSEPAVSPYEAPEPEALPSALSIAMADEEPAQPTASGGVAAVESHGASALLDEEFILDIPPAPAAEQPATASADAPLPVVVESRPMLVPGSREWDALAEEIRMQVLQRLDLFTDTGMRDQLGARLQPIVDRASAALVETINRELGELVRGYVAEAIEREIESWRKRSG